VRRIFVSTAVGLLALGVLAGCSSNDSVSVNSGKVKVEKKGDKLTVKDGDNSISVGDAKLPASFPDGVPLPEKGTLKAVVSGKRSGDEYFSLTYSIEHGSVAAAAKSYRRALEEAGFKVKTSASVGGSSGSFAAFTAAGSDWDVVVYSGGGTGGDGALSLQVTPHSAANDLPGAGTGSG
jgi:hypothetical protein